MDEQKAVGASQSGDKDAFGFLIDRYYQNIYRFAYQYTGCHQDADDICQETFLRAFSKIKQLKNSSSFRGWIFMIASNLSRRHIKRMQLKKNLARPGIFQSISGDSQDDNNHPLQKLCDREKAMFIRKQLLKMPEQMRLAAVLVHAEGFSQKEAAEILNCSEPTISRELAKARTWLRSRLEDLI